MSIATHPRLILATAAVAVVLTGLVAGCDSGSGHQGTGTTSSGHTGSSSGSSSDDAYRRLRDQVTENSNDGYFDHCQWSEGCGGDINAFDGDDSNSLTGSDTIDPLGDYGSADSSSSSSDGSGY